MLVEVRAGGVRRGAGQHGFGRVEADHQGVAAPGVGEGVGEEAGEVARSAGDVQHDARAVVDESQIADGERALDVHGGPAHAHPQTEEWAPGPLVDRGERTESHEALSGS